MKRVPSHVIDTRGTKKVLQHCPDSWVIRNLTERDYGIDLVLEIFESTSPNQHYHSSGCLLNVQLKSTQKRFSKVDNNGYSALKARLKTRSLLYAESFALPFLLFTTQVTDQESPVYYVWLQKYIRFVLDADRPKWREDSLDREQTIYIPEDNVLQANDTAKLRRIASTPKYLDELSEFTEVFSTLKNRIEDPNFYERDEHYNLLRDCLQDLYRKKALMDWNECGVSNETVKKAITSIINMKNKIEGTFEDEAWEDLERLANSLIWKNATESFLFKTYKEVPF